MITTYGKVLAFGTTDRRIHGVLDGPVVVQEKIDGSQFSFGIPEYETEVICRSKGQLIETADGTNGGGLFQGAVTHALSLGRRDMISPGWVYRGEAMSKEKHNTIRYGRVPAGNIVLFDVQRPDGGYLSMTELFLEAERIGVEVTQVFYDDEIITMDELKSLLGSESMLGEHSIEGVVVKNYANLVDHGDGVLRPQRAKLVDAAFREDHKKDWKNRNPGRGDVINLICEELGTSQRYGKCVQQLAEAGRLQGDPRDIGPLMKAFSEDLADEEAAYIKDRLFEVFIKDIVRGASKRLPYWYKEKLLSDFEEEVA